MSAAKRSLEIEQLEDTINERTVFVHEMLIFFVGVVFGVINLVAHEDRANIISGIFILVSVTLTVAVSELLKKHISRLARGILLSTVQIIIIIAAGVTNSQLHTVHSLLVASVALSTIYFSRKNIVVQCTITNAVCIAGIFFMDKIYQGATLEVVIKSLVGVNVADYLIWYLVKTCAKYIIENRKDKEHSDELVEQINAEMAKASQMAEKTNSAVEKMARIAENLSSSATLMEQISGTLSAGAQEQESTVSEISSDIMGVVNQYDRCLDEADKSLQAAECNVTVLHEGNEDVHSMMSAMNDINSASEQIESIIRTIEDIAFQTNILALNAAVEAARAGSAGKGFAVVADEVRNLATKSAEAAKHTSELIDLTRGAVKNGTECARRVADRMDSAIQTAEQSSGHSKLITELTKDSVTSVNKVKNKVENISYVVSQTSQTSEESAEISRSVSEEVRKLNEIIAARTRSNRST